MRKKEKEGTESRKRRLNGGSITQRGAEPRAQVEECTYFICACMLADAVSSHIWGLTGKKTP